MEKTIGEVFEYNGKKLKVVECNFGCENCFFDTGENCIADERLIGECAAYYREDKKSVIFKLLEVDR